MSVRRRNSLDLQALIFRHAECDMRKTILVSLLGLALMSAAQAETITVNVVDGIKKPRGTIYAAAREKEDFDIRRMLADCAVKASAPVTSTTATVVLENVPQGRFAVMVFHDANSSGKLDFGMIGMPVEPGGFSAPEKELFPSFEKAALDVGAGPIYINVKMRCMC
jgi:uncharacterized protein (DUF2141 family)